jgi:putative ATPase
LNALELGALSTKPGADGTVLYDLPTAEESIQKKALVYDEDEHYDTISAFIKSLRGSDPDAALYWMAKMIYAGEDPLFIARRLVIAASEDVGNADPRALMVATAAYQAVERIGMPEGTIPLAQAATYVASAPKSNAAYLGIKAAMADIEQETVLPVPDHLKDAHYKGAARLGRGKGYKYPHDYPGHYVAQDYLPEMREYYRPSEQGEEKRIKERLAGLKKRSQEEQR